MNQQINKVTRVKNSQADEIIFSTPLRRVGFEKAGPLGIKVNFVFTRTIYPSILSREDISKLLSFLSEDFELGIENYLNKVIEIGKKTYEAGKPILSPDEFDSINNAFLRIAQWRKQELDQSDNVLINEKEKFQH